MPAALSDTVHPCPDIPNPIAVQGFLLAAGRHTSRSSQTRREASRRSHLKAARPVHPSTPGGPLAEHRRLLQSDGVLGSLQSHGFP